MEIELKLLIDPADTDKLCRHPLIERCMTGPARQDVMRAIYFDTPDFLLLRRGAGLRVREAAGQWVQTMKAGGGVSGGLHQRNEWESPVADARPELAALAPLIERKSRWAKLLERPSLAERLQPLFAVNVTRTTWNLLVEGDAIELVLDNGSIEHEGSTIPVSEIELELKCGSPARLYDIALQLLADMPLRLSDVSKAERGYALCLPAEAKIAFAKPMTLEHGLTIEQGMRVIFSDCLAQIHGNEAGVLNGGNTESVHQMRVGLRRLRAAVHLFDKIIPFPDDLHEELRWLGEALGAAREWDVLATSILPAAASRLHGTEQLAALQNCIASIAQDKRAAAGHAVASARYGSLMLHLFAWLEGGYEKERLSAEDKRNLAAPLARFARNVVVRRHKRLIKHGKHLDAADAQDLHRLRIAAKTARYASEFFVSFHRHKQLRRYVAALSALQDDLGWRNDVSVSSTLLQQLESERPELGNAASFMRGYLSAQLVRANDRKLKSWKRFRRVPSPRKV